MRTDILKRTATPLLTLILLASPFTSALSQTTVRAAKSCASPQQDLELGRQAAAEAEKQFQVLRDERVQQYIQRLGATLVQNAPGERFPYTFTVLNVAEINAFALPGGPTYVNRGTIEAARTEAELAGVMAHEISHVVLRHGTANVCRAQKYQIGVGILGAILGNGALGQLGTTGASIFAGGALMRNSREAESDADVLGSQIMAKAGYDPTAMADFFETLRDEQGRDPGKLERWFSDHPAPADRRDRIKKEAQLIGYRGPGREIGGFTEVKRSLMGMAKAPSMRGNQQGAQERPTASSTRSGEPVNVRIEPPSATVRTFRPQSGLFEISYPQNWQVTQSQIGSNAMIFPSGGATQDGGIVYGVLINQFQIQNQQNIDPRTRRVRTTSLTNATQEIISTTTQENNYLRVVNQPERTGSIGGRETMTATLEGHSPLTNRDEKALLYNMQLKNGDTLYLIFVAPKDDFGTYQNHFRRMLQSLKINE